MKIKLTKLIPILTASLLPVTVNAGIPERGLPRGSGRIAISQTRDSGTHRRSARQLQRTARLLPGSALNLDPMQAPVLAPGMSPLYGTIVFAGSWSNYDKAGVYQLPLPEFTSFYPVHTDPSFAVENAVMTADGYYVTYWQEGMFGEFQWTQLYDPQTWEAAGDAKLVQKEWDASALAFDAKSGRIYGSFRKGENNYVYGWLSPQSNVLNEIGTASAKGFTSMASDGKGNIYATTTDGEFAKVEPSTGAATKISSVGLVSAYNTGAAIDPAAAVYYYEYVTDEVSALYKIDLATGTATKVYDMPDSESVLGMWVESGAAKDENVPGFVDNLKVELTGSSLTAKVSFTLPSELYDGSAAAGNMSYVIQLDGTSAVEGEGKPGQNVSVNVTAPAAGTHTVSVFARNSAGDGPDSKLTQWWGSDELTPIIAPIAIYKEGTVALAWVMPEAANGGYLAPGAVTFDVIRMPGNETVATGLTRNYFTESLPEPDEITRYTYEVRVYNSGSLAQSVVSNPIVLGSVSLPYSQSFDAYDALDYFTVINANNDAKSWELVNNAARMSYDQEKAMDDWLILPPVRLTKGAYYEIAFDAWANDPNYPEQFEVRIGRAPDEESMTIPFVGKTSVIGSELVPLHVSDYFSPDTDGLYYIGIHACSPANSFYLYVDNISIASGLEQSAPAAVANLKAKAADYGEMKAELSFTAPEKDIVGRKLGSISKIRIFRNGASEAAVSLDATPGKSLTWTDNNPAAGINTYRVIAYSGNTVGEETSTECFVGVGRPLQPSNVRLSRGSDTGEVVISWDQVTKDENGMLLRPGQVTYDVYRVIDETRLVVSSGSSELTASDRACKVTDPEDFFLYSVRAYTSYGGSDEVISRDFIPAGKAAAIPYAESVSGGHISNNLALDVPEENGSYWEVSDDEYVDGITSEDGDNGFFVMTSPYTHYSGSLLTGNIALDPKYPAPELSFYYYDYQSQNQIDVQINDGQGFVPLKTVTLRRGEGEGWTRVAIDLSAWAGKTVQLAFKGMIIDTNVIAIDNIRICQANDRDLAVRDLRGPAEGVEQGDDFTLSVLVENAGTASADGYTVTLYEDSEPVQTVSGPSLAPGATADVKFTVEASVFLPDAVKYYAIGNLEGDAVADNNASQPVEVKIVRLPLPAVKDLSASAEGNEVTLTWTAPDPDSAVPAAVTDDLESYVPFSIGLPGSQVEDDNIGEWTMIDGDQAPFTFVIQNALEMPNDTGAKAFIVYNGEMAGVEGARSGNQMFMCFGAVAADGETVVQNDDWVISPRLYGGEQTVVFYARSANSQWLESMETYYSLSGRDRNDFVKVDSYKDVPGEWTRCEIKLPEGARFFAVRCTSRDKFALCLDDFTYLPGDNTVAALKLEGFNLYRDRRKHSSSLLAATSFVDRIADAKEEHAYHVTVKWDLGESVASNAAYVNRSGVVAPGADGIAVRPAAGGITVTGAEGKTLTVASADGTVRYRAFRAAGSETIHLPAGVYVVKAGTHTAKVVVR